MWVKVAQSCLTLCDPMNYTVHGILQARILEWVDFLFSRGSSQPRDWIQVSLIAGRFFISWAARESQWMWELEYKEGWVPKNWYFWTVVLEKTLESPLDCKIKPVNSKGTLNSHGKDECWSWSSNTLATWYEELTYWKRPWCRERLKTGEGGNIGQDGWIVSLTQWTWVWASSGRWWRTGKPDVLQPMGSRRDGHAWETEKQNAQNIFTYSMYLADGQQSPVWTSLLTEFIKIKQKQKTQTILNILIYSFQSFSKNKI